MTTETPPWMTPPPDDADIVTVLEWQLRCEASILDAMPQPPSQARRALDKITSLRAENAELRETVRRVQRSARTLTATQKEIYDHYQKASKINTEAVATLDSEREANAILTAENAELQRKLDEAADLLDDAQDIFNDAAHPSRVTPDQEVNNEVRELGRRIGFGALMSCASAQWREMLAAGGIAGGEFVCSPCRSTASNAADRIDAFLTSIRGKA